MTATKLTRHHFEPTSYLPNNNYEESRFQDQEAGPSRCTTPRNKQVQFRTSTEDMALQTDSCAEIKDTWHSELLTPESADKSEQTLVCEQICGDELVRESEQIRENEQISMGKQVIESEQMSVGKQVFESEQVCDSEQVCKGKEMCENEQVGESKQIGKGKEDGESEQICDTKQICQDKLICESEQIYDSKEICDGKDRFGGEKKCYSENFCLIDEKCEDGEVCDDKLLCEIEKTFASGMTFSGKCDCESGECEQSDSDLCPFSSRPLISPNESPRGPPPQPTSIKNSPMSFLKKIKQDPNLRKSVSPRPKSPPTVQNKGCLKEMEKVIEELYFNETVEAENSDTSYDLGRENECRNRDYGNDERRLRESTSSLEAGTSDAVRVHYFRQKFHSTLQILRNKEETLRVQTESLAVAEARIEALTTRAARMRHELDNKTLEIKEMRKMLNKSPRIYSEDLISTDVQTEPGKLDEKELIKTLQTNYSIIEELYRKCFYESAKQEEMIESLRKSCIEVRQLERLRTEEVRRLRGVVRSQGNSLEMCQDVATEVDNLKAEITSFLNSSNNDSGMWEREESISADIAEDLQQIADLLTQLYTVLAIECDCKSKAENQKLRAQIIKMEQQVREAEAKCVVMQQQTCKCGEHPPSHGEELDSLKRTVEQFEEKNAMHQRNIANLKSLLNSAEGQIQAKMTELAAVKQHAAEQERALSELRQRVDAEQQAHRSESGVQCDEEQWGESARAWRREAAGARQRAARLESDLLRARDTAARLGDSCREKEAALSLLREQLQTAQQQGAALCGEARRVVGAVRAWLRDMRATHRAQKEKIAELECKINHLKRRLNRSAADKHDAGSQAAGGAGPSRQPAAGRRPPAACARCAARRVPGPASPDSPTPPSKRCAKDRDRDNTSRSNKSVSFEERRSHSHKSAVRVSSPSSSETPSMLVTSDNERELSPGEELLERVDLLQEALEESHKRWSRGRNGIR